MSVNESSHRPGRPRIWGSLRMVAVGCAALLLVNGAFNASFAQGTKGDYGGNLSTAEAVAIGVGVAAAGVLAAGALGQGPLAGLVGQDTKGAMGCPAGQLLPNGDAKVLPPLPAGAEIAEVCVAPENSRLSAGSCRTFDFRAKNKADGNWYSLTNRAETTISVRDPDLAQGALVKLDGSKSTFCVPITTGQSANGRSLVVIATFAPAGVRPMTSEARVQLLVTGRMR